MMAAIVKMEGRLGERGANKEEFLNKRAWRRRKGRRRRREKKET